MVDLDDGAAGAQRRVVGDFLHRMHRGAGDVELAQDVHRLELGLVLEPVFDGAEDVHDVRLARLGRHVKRVALPFGLADGVADRRPGLALDGEVDVGVGVGLPALALEHPARLAASAGIAAARHHVGELAVRVLGVLLQVAQLVQAQLVTQLDAAQVDHRVLHRAGHLLALARLVALAQRGEDADGQVHAGIAVAQRRGADGGRAVPEAGGRRRAAGTLGDVLVDLQVFVVVAVGEALDRGQDHARVQLQDAFPGEAHAVERAGAEVLDHHVGDLDQLFQHFLAFGRLGVQRQRTLVAVELGEVERVGVGDVAQLVARDIARTRAFDLDHVGAEPGQHLGAGGTGLDMGEVDDLDVF